MKRSLYSAALGAIAALMLVTPAVAETRVEAITRQLASQGYTDIEVSRTFLGRVQIEANRGGLEREIILNPRSGEILRDYWEVEDDDDDHGGILGESHDDKGGQDD
ncbi:hypothetical protein [Shimia sp.]|uniref:hypothetical protein n=1 Tax=Shimia sp. TaxID=1954381 RepID=UPI003298934D